MDQTLAPRDSLVSKAAKCKDWSSLLRSLRLDFWQASIDETGISLDEARGLDTDLLIETLCEVGCVDDHADLIIAAVFTKVDDDSTTQEVIPAEHMDVILREIPGLAADDLTPSERATLLADKAYWRKLCPMLHLEDDRKNESSIESAVDLSPELVAMCRERMLYDGYFDLEAAVLSWAVDIDAMAEVINLQIVQHSLSSYPTPYCAFLVHKLLSYQRRRCSVLAQLAGHLGFCSCLMNPGSLPGTYILKIRNNANSHDEQPAGMKAIKGSRLCLHRE